MRSIRQYRPYQVDIHKFVTKKHEGNFGVEGPTGSGKTMQIVGLVAHGKRHKRWKKILIATTQQQIEEAIVHREYDAIAYGGGDKGNMVQHIRVDAHRKTWSSQVLPSKTVVREARSVLESSGLPEALKDEDHQVGKRLVQGQRSMADVEDRRNHSWNARHMAYHRVRFLLREPRTVERVAVEASEDGARTEKRSSKKVIRGHAV